MINRFWKGYASIPYHGHDALHDIEAIVYELNNRDINSLYKLFYIIKPMIPRYLQIYLRRVFANFVIERGYENIEMLFHRALLECTDIDTKPFPFIWFWPGRKSVASIVTHDIETISGFQRVLDLADIDSQYHIKSSFKFVPEGYAIDQGVIRELKRRGFEIALHGLNHDGRLFVSKKVFSQKLMKIEDYAKQWQTEGFRSPSLLRDYPLMKTFKFNWDSSYPDWDPFGPQPGGCRTVFPYFISDYTVELPVTLMQDHTLFEILNKKEISIWRDKFKYIRSLSGLANIIIHPDYIFKHNRIDYYRQYLEFVNGESNVWQAYPYEVANWWRERDRSVINKKTDGSLYIEGPSSSKATIAKAITKKGKLHFIF
jgi:peptidoglycan/xylan/chitin deacetylase (PgdA/CDA1 family)